MNRTLSYILISFALLCVMVVPRVLNPGIGRIMIIDDVIGYCFVVIGFFVFRKPVQRNIARLDKSAPWNVNPIERSIREILSIAKWTLGSCMALMLLIAIWFHFMGPPKFIKVLDEQHHQSLPRIHDPASPDQSVDMEEYAKPHKPPGRKSGPPRPVSRDSAAYFLSEVFGVCLLLFFFLFGAEEVSALNQRLQTRALNEERRIKDEAVAKYAALQQQLNPHFMFNTLNVLTGLVHEDSDKAEEYVKKLSDVYRYVLTQSNQATASIEEEIDFIKDYIFLQQIRFDEKLQLFIEAPAQYMSRRIPSLAIELLVENAIKHNSIKASSPLKISIIVTHNSVEVSNNIQLRLDKVDSTEIGLANLYARMKLLGLDPPVSTTDNGFYRTILPSLPPAE